MVWCVMGALPLLCMAFAGSVATALTSTSALRVTMGIVTISDTDLYELPCPILKGIVFKVPLLVSRDHNESSKSLMTKTHCTLYVLNK